MKEHSTVKKSNQNENRNRRDGKNWKMSEQLRRVKINYFRSSHTLKARNSTMFPRLRSTLTRGKF